MVVADGTSKAPQSRGFQFSLKMFLEIGVSLAVGTSLISCHFWLGSIAAILVVGSWWCWAAVRAGRPKLAYRLAAVVIGVGPWYLFLPAFFGPGPSEMIQVVPLTCLASLTAASILRRQILREGPQFPSGAMFLAIYLTAIFFTWYLGMAIAGQAALMHWMRGWPGPDFWPGLLGTVFMGMGVMGPVFAVVGATLTLPITIPIALAGVAVLRKVDPTRFPPRTPPRASISARAKYEAWSAHTPGQTGPPPA